MAQCVFSDSSSWPNLQCLRCPVFVHVNALFNSMAAALQLALFESMQHTALVQYVWSLLVQACRALRFL